MGVDTKGRLKGKVLPEEVLNFIRQKYDMSASMDIKTETHGMIKQKDYIKESYGKSFLDTLAHGRIDFKDGEDTRILFYFYRNTNSYENLKFYSAFGLEDMVKSETTYISLGYWGNSVDIIKSIVTHFGGWIDENDCDDKEYYEIEKVEEDIKPCIHVSMTDIYEKFGATLIID